MKPFEQEQGDQGCPNLDAEGVFAGADEGLHGEVLFQGFEEQFDFPAVLKDGGNGGGAWFFLFPYHAGRPEYLLSLACHQPHSLGYGQSGGDGWRRLLCLG